MILDGAPGLFTKKDKFYLSLVSFVDCSNSHCHQKEIAQHFYTFYVGILHTKQIEQAH